MVFWDFTSFQATKHQHASSNRVYHQHVYLVVHRFVMSKKVFHWELRELVLPYT